MDDKFWVYVLELNNGKKYIGHTNNLKRRLEEHCYGKSPFTRKNPMKKLVYFEEFPNRAKAMKREKFFKSGQGRLWLNEKLAEQSASGG